MPTQVCTSWPVTGCPTAPAAQAFWGWEVLRFPLLWPGFPFKDLPRLCLPQEFRSDSRCPFPRIPSGLEHWPSKLGENCPAHSCPRTLGQVSSPCQRGRAQGGWEEGRMPAGRGHCLQTESGSFLSTPENGAATLAQEVRLLQGKSPRDFPLLSPRTKGLPQGYQGTA